MPKSCRWMEDFSDWLIPAPFGDSDISDDLWCKYCKKPVKRKKYNAIKHASTARHCNLYEGKLMSISKTKRESDHVMREMSYIDSDKLLGIESPTDDMEETAQKISLAKRRKHLSSSYDIPTISYQNPMEDYNEVDAFARSIAAQMKTLPEKYIIGLTFDIQNLVTQKRLQALEDKNMEKHSGLENPQVINVPPPPNMQSTSVTYTYQ